MLQTVPSLLCRRLRLRGRLNDSKDVVVSFGSSPSSSPGPGGDGDGEADFCSSFSRRELTIRNVHLYHRNKLEENVTFHLGFTFGGPAAFDVRSDDAEVEREKLRAIAKGGAAWGGGEHSHWGGEGKEQQEGQARGGQKEEEEDEDEEDFDDTFL